MLWKSAISFARFWWKWKSHLLMKYQTVVGLFVVPAFPQHGSVEFTGAALGSEIPHKILLSRPGALLIANLFPMNNSTTSCHCSATRLSHTPHSVSSLTPPNGAGKGSTGVPKAWNIPWAVLVWGGEEPGLASRTAAAQGLHLQIHYSIPQTKPNMGCG